MSLEGSITMRDVVTYEIDGRTAIITINRANKLNALDEEVIQETNRI